MVSSSDILNATALATVIHFPPMFGAISSKPAKEDIDMVIFRENTEELYVGVEFSPAPDELKATLGN